MVRRGNVHPKHRNQAAVDFLISWGWVIAIVVVAMLVLFDLGVFNTPQQATLINGFQSVQVEDAGVNGSLAVFQLNNQFGRDINIDSIMITSNGNVFSPSTVQCTVSQLTAGQSAVCRVPLSLNTSNYEISVAIRYSPSTSNTIFFSNGTVSGRLSNGVINLNNANYYFRELALPDGATWSVTLGGLTKNATVSSSTGDVISFSAAFGAYNYNVSNVTFSGCSSIYPYPLNGIITGGVTKDIAYNGTCPTTFTETGLGQYIYATNRYNNTIEVIDTATDSVVRNITSQSQPAELALSADDQYLYATNLDNGSVQKFSVSTGALVSTFSGIKSPFMLSIGSNGDLYTMNYFGKLDVVNSTTGTIIVANMSIGGIGANVAAVPSKDIVYATNATYNLVLFGHSYCTGDVVYALNSTTNTIITSIPVGTCPYGVAVAPNGTYAYVANFVSNTTSVISTATNTVVATINVGKNPSAVAVSPNSKYVYVGNQASNTVSVISTATNTVIATINLGSGKSPSIGASITVTPDGRYVYVADQPVGNNGASISIISTATNSVIANSSQQDFSIISAATISSNPYTWNWSVTYGGKTKSSTNQSITFNSNLGNKSYSAISSKYISTSSIDCDVLYSPNVTAGEFLAGSSLLVGFNSSTSCTTTFVSPGRNYNSSLYGTSWWVKYGTTNISNYVGKNFTFTSAQGGQTIYGRMIPYVIQATGGYGMNNCVMVPPLYQTAGFTFNSTWSCDTSFYEDNLPSNYNWSVRYAGTVQWSETRYINFTTGTGVYNRIYTVMSNSSINASGFHCTTVYEPSPNSSGPLTAGDFHPPGASYGGPVVDYVSSTSCDTAITTFNEIGMFSGASWSVYYNGTLNSSSAPNSITFSRAAGNVYSFSVPAPSNSSAGCITSYSANVTSGSLTSGSTKTIGFTHSTSCTTKFIVAGLPPNTVWPVTFDGVTKYPIGSSVTFTTTSGSYSYTEGPVYYPPDCVYSPDLSSGTLTAGSNYSVTYSAPSGPNCLIFVANYGSNSVSEIDTATNSLVATMGTGESPVDMALNMVNDTINIADYGPSGGTCFVGNSEVCLINVTTRKIITGISTPGVRQQFGGGPTIALSPNEQYTYVIGQGLSSPFYGYLYIINNKNDQLVSTINLGDNPLPSGIVVTPNGEYVYVVNSYAQSLIKIDTITNSIVSTLNGDCGTGGTVLCDPSGMAMSPNGKYIYIANAGDNHITVIDTSSGRDIKNISLGAGVIHTATGIALSPNGLLYTSNYWGNTTEIINATSYSVVSTVNLGYGTEPMGITAPTAINGQLYVYVALSKVGKVAVLSASTNSVIENITVGANPEGIYSVPEFTTSFVESGLASGLTWSVTYDNIKSSSASAAIGITVPEGTYYFSIPNVQGNLVCNHQLGVGTQYYYAPSPASGSAVGGSTENVTFTIYSKTVSC